MHTSMTISEPANHMQHLDRVVVTYLKHACPCYLHSVTFTELKTSITLHLFNFHI